MVPPYVDSLPTRLTILLVISTLVMFLDDHKRFERFIHLTPLKFSGAIWEDTYEFLLDYCQERLHNFRSLETYGVIYTIY